MSIKQRNHSSGEGWNPCNLSFLSCLLGLMTISYSESYKQLLLVYTNNAEFLGISLGNVSF